MCSVRHRPIPSAAKLRAVCASAGVSALARTPMSRRASAQSSSVRNASSSTASCTAVSPARTSPVLPSTVTNVPAANLRPSGATMPPPRRSIVRSDAPTTQGSPRPRPITAAWLVMPPRAVTTASAACMPRISSGVVSRRTRMQGSPRAALACASSAVSTIRPVAAPGLAAMPRTMRSRGASAAICRCSSADSALGGTRRIASSREITPSRASATAIATVARSDRGTRTASRIDNSPSCSVNSISISSRRRVRIRPPAAVSAANASGHRSSSEGPRSSRVRYSASPCRSAARPWLCALNRPAIPGAPVPASTKRMTPDPLSPGPTPSAIACTTRPSPAPTGAPFASRSRRALVPSQARAMERSTSASWVAGSCGNASSVSAS